MTAGGHSRRTAADADDEDGDSHASAPLEVGEEATSFSQNGKSYADAVQTAKHHLSVCLKLLGIMYRNDEDPSTPDRSGCEHALAKQDELGSIWPAETRGDSLYLAMVMLNSALLKALHVADSFQLHCHREFPKMAAQTQDSPGDTGPCCDRPGLRSDDRRITSEEYRRLQAECLVLCETAWSLEQQRDSEKARVKQLEDDCRQIRTALAKQQEPQANEPSPRPEDPEVAELRSMGVTAEWRADGGVVISDGELQRLTLIMQNLNRIVQEARADAADSLQKSEEATRRAEQAKREREELQQLLGCDHDGLQSATRQLVEDLSKASEQEQLLEQQEQQANGAEEVWEQVRELQAQDQALEQQCHDLSIENSKLEEAASAGGLLGSAAAEGQNGRSGSAREVMDCEDAMLKASPQQFLRRPGRHQAAAEDPGARRNRSAVGGGVGHAPGRSGGAMFSENGGGPDASTASGHSSRKPFVVCSSSRSHHTSAHGHSHHRSGRRGAPGAMPDDHLFAKAALRYARNPGDPQAYGKLQSLIGNTNTRGRGGAGAAPKEAGATQEVAGDVWLADQQAATGSDAPPVEWSRPVALATSAAHPGPWSSVGHGGIEEASQQPTHSAMPTVHSSAIAAAQAARRAASPNSAVMPEARRAASPSSAMVSEARRAASPSSAMVSEARRAPSPSSSIMSAAAQHAQMHPAAPAGVDANPRLLMQLGKVRGQPWATTRTTWPMPDRRM